MRGISIDIQDIHSCTREQIIRPIVHIDSAPVYACETVGEDRIAIGFCFLSAYRDIGNDIKAAFGRALRYSPAQMNVWVEKNHLTDCEIFGWSMEPQLFAGVPNNLKPDSKSTRALISDFRFLNDDPFYIRIEHLVISQKDLNILESYWEGINASKKEKIKVNRLNLNHHSTKRIQILKAAVAVVHHYRTNIVTGKSIFNFIKEEKWHIL